MADPIKRNTLLPPIGTPRERAIGGANAAVNEVDQDIIRRAGSPDIAEVPAEYLAARAEARSVDVWDPLWPDDVKRAAIVAAPIVHRHKGTRLAVKTALAALRIDATISEWWEEVPRGEPYTFTVRAYARARLYDGPLLDARLVRVAYAAVLRAKPESRAFDFILGVNFPTTLGLAPMLAARARVSRAAVPQAPAPHSTAALGLAPVFAATVSVARAVAPKPSTGTAAVLGLGPVLAGKVRVARAVIPALPPA